MDILRYKSLVEEELMNIGRGERPAELYAPISYILSLGGKRLRPAVVLLACELFNGKPSEALPCAIGLEVFHNFTLLHDDIMDNAPLRRNKPTVHEKWNANVAILSGDAMFVMACQYMAKTPSAQLKEVLDIFYRTALEVCEGQQMDMNFEERNDVSLAEYEEMIGLKTAVLLGACFQIGALVGGASKADAQLLYDFGKQMGIAFQLQDDILDVYGDNDKFGKLTGGDIIADKKTFLLLKAFEIAGTSQREQLENLVYNGGSQDKTQKVQAVTAIYDELEVVAHAQKEMEANYERGLAALAETSLSIEKKDLLRSFAQSLLRRDF